MNSQLYLTSSIRPARRVISASVIVLIVSFFATTSVFSQTRRFLDAPQFPTTGYVDDVVVADFNRGGIDDIATCGVGDSQSAVNILIGNGNGTFQAPKAYVVGEGPVAIAVADLNGDGNLDIVTADAGIDDGFNNKVTVLLGSGDGTFRPHRDYTAGSYPNSVAIADFNGDGKLDIVAGDKAYFAVLLGKGDGTFQKAIYTRSAKYTNSRRGGRL